MYSGVSIAAASGINSCANAMRGTSDSAASCGDAAKCDRPGSTFMTATFPSLSRTKRGLYGEVQSASHCVW